MTLAYVNPTATQFLEESLRKTLTQNRFYSSLHEWVDFLRKREPCGWISQTEKTMDAQKELTSI